MTQGILIALAVILVIFSVVVVHESGHFVVGKLSGIRVDEFSVGFGPKLFAKRRGETQYSLRLLPLGGYVRMAGMLGIAGEPDAGERNFYRAGIPKRFLTIAAGILFNFAFAIVCFTIVNMAASHPWQTVPGGAVAAAGVPNGAVVTSVDGRSIRDDSQDSVGSDLRAATRASQGAPVRVTYRDTNGVVRTTTVKPQLGVFNPVKGALPAGVLVVTSVDGHPVGQGDPSTLLRSGTAVSGYLEAKPSSTFTATLSGNVGDGYGTDATHAQAAWLIGVVAGWDGQPFPTAVANATLAIPNFITGTATGIYDLITQPQLGGLNGPNGLSGPVGIAQATATASQNGFLSDHGLLWWIGFISMNLGLVNVLPIPFLDGGKLLFLVIEAVRRKRMDPRYEAAASAIGLAVVVLLLIYVTIGDVGRIV